MKKLLYRPVSKILSLLALWSCPAMLFAGDGKKSALDNPVVIVMLTVIVALLIVIVLLAYVLSGTAQYYMKRYRETQPGKKITMLLFFCLAGASAFSQEEPVAAVAKDRSVAGLSESTFFALMSVIGLELIVILSIAFFLKRLLAKEEVAAVTETVEEPHKQNLLIKLWQRANRFRSAAEEADIDLGHDYDSIRELDNRLPPWWLYGFYCTILFAVIYLWRFEVSHSAPSSLQEYTAEVKLAEEEKEAYLARAANKVDENTVKMLDESGIASGRAIFTGTCAPCHSADGGGGVGPNLTDDYWLHGGGVKDIFKTIKYGVQEKGMKSWKDDFSPVQIAQLASFIRSIHGTKPANPKEPQGEPLKEVIADSARKIATINP